MYDLKDPMLSGKHQLTGRSKERYIAAKEAVGQFINCQLQNEAQVATKESEIVGDPETIVVRKTE
ncbi:hypothetical protein PZB75_30635 (plasmid) [Streptomyces sp. AM 4-1-1]|uniref:hypothetical protein n=1 Tax=Streptomyces sp. AM 4-1-1 TaxID=3028710 RepID=UPI0023B98FD9|nr:hypothetical protein [Streptomyces sp. AM 4-1-1]WEH37762.1 hypothetical protein PZB75_30635 [Streptomyces sp. AM 4-1-1]